uniref:Uncharacterized protein n=1 Tax=Laticauda laticaudata TaxID=8630 RepID=A0A8C5WTS3_LATLA
DSLFSLIISHYLFLSPLSFINADLKNVLSSYLAFQRKTVEQRWNICFPGRGSHIQPSISPVIYSFCFVFKASYSRRGESPSLGLLQPIMKLKSR